MVNNVDILHEIKAISFVHPLFVELDFLNIADKNILEPLPGVFWKNWGARLDSFVAFLV